MGQEQERCKMCDRVECNLEAERIAFNATSGGEDSVKQWEVFVAARDNCRAHAVDWRQRALDAEAKLSRYERHDIALGDIHILCADAGVPEGNVVERVAQLKDRLLQAEARERWVSVEERLPDYGVDVDVYTEGGRRMNCALTACSNRPQCCSGIWHGYDGWEVSGVTHWRPLPAAPEVP